MTYGDIDFDKKDQHLDKRKFQVIWRMVMMMLIMIIKMYIVHLGEETIAGRSGQLQCCWSDSSHQETGSFGPGKLF